MALKSLSVRIELTDLTFVENLDTPRIMGSI